jgi:hypothetical protein
MWPLLRSLRWNCFVIPLIPAFAAMFAVVLLTVWFEAKRNTHDADRLGHRLHTIARVLQDQYPGDFSTSIEQQNSLGLSAWESLAVYAPTTSASSSTLYPRIAGRRLVPLEDEENVHPCVIDCANGSVRKGPEGWYGAVSFSSTQGKVFVLAGLMHCSDSLWLLSALLLSGIAISGVLGAWYSYRHLYQPVESVLHQAQAALHGDESPLQEFHSEETEAVSSAVHDLAVKYRNLASHSRESHLPPSEE